MWSVEVNERRVWKLMRGPATSPRRGVALQSLEGLPSHVVTGDQQPRVAQNILGVDKYTSIRQAAKAYNVPRSTLADRQHGKPLRSAAHEQQQRLTPAQEEFLTEWILEQDLQGYAPSHTRVREMAARILRMNGDIEPLGKAWVPKYIQRNPRV